MPIIEAKNIGLKFTLNKGKKQSLKYNLSTVMNRKKPQYDNEFWALRNLSFSLDHGEILGVIGGNGAGKSTLLRTIGGIYHPDEGELKVNGTVSALLSLGTGFKQDLNGYDNIYLNGVIMGFSKDEIEKHVWEIIRFSELGKFIYQPVKNYSSGMSARLGFSIAAFLHREIMLIDEILGVGDQKFKKKSQEKMQEMITDGRTVVIVSHNLESIKRYATKAIWIEDGLVKMAGSPDSVIEEYLKE